jgi:glycosyltransferase involved in cell wall biosynthesis
MRVLLVPYPDTWRIEGGHRTQQAQTVAALQRAGIDAELAELGERDFGDFDVVHFFGDPRPLLAYGRPRGLLAVSPVHFPAAIELGPIPWRGGRLAVARTQARHRVSSFRHPRARRRRRADFRGRLDALCSSDLVVVNSPAEGRLLTRDARGTLPPLRVAHSGVDDAFFAGSAEEGRRIVGDEQFVLCVARVEPIKNQISLALAMRGVPARLVLVGAVLPGNETYLDACRQALPSLVHLDHIDRAMLPHLHAAAAVHALPSWYETTGLSTLEALAAGTPVVVGRSPCVDDYFSGCAYVANPGDVHDLRAALMRALAGPRGNERERAASFNWDRTARELLEAYGA